MPFQPQIKNILEDQNSFATTLVVSLIDVYGVEMFKWLPETIRLETESDFGVKWPQANFDRLMTAIMIITTDSFYSSLPDFIEFCNILSGAAATPGVFSPADAAECAWGVTEALLLAPPDEDEPFNEEIRSYIGRMIEMEGIINPPDILRIGILQGDHKTKVHNNFSDDPDMYGSIWEVEQSKTDDINDLVKSRLTLLVTQLSVLKLDNGDTTQIAAKMLTSLNRNKGGGSL